MMQLGWSVLHNLAAWNRTSGDVDETRALFIILHPCLVLFDLLSELS